MDGHLSDFESSLAAWGYVYGMAFALERLQDPFESGARVADRAYEIAWSEFVRYNGHYEIPDGDRLVRELEQAWEDVHEAVIRGGDSSVPVTPELTKAIDRVIGSPRYSPSSDPPLSSCEISERNLCWVLIAMTSPLPCRTSRRARSYDSD